MNLSKKFHRGRYLPIRLAIYPYNMQSTSARALANALEVKRIRQNGRYRWRPGKRVINWGNSNIANWMVPAAMDHIMNKPANIELASNKSIAFVKLFQAGIPVPDFEFTQMTAQVMLTESPKYPGLKHAVLCRTLTRANSGRGIVVAPTSEELVSA